MYKIKSKKIKSNTKTLLLVLVILLIGSTYYILANDNSDYSDILGVNPTPTVDFINLDPPTQQDKQEVEQNKQEILKPEKDKVSQPEPTKTNATMIITYAGQYNGVIEAASIVQGIFEDGGVCTYTLTNQTQSIQKVSTGVANVSNTLCPAISIERSEVNSFGLWVMSVTYVSNTITATSNLVEIEIK